MRKITFFLIIIISKAVAEEKCLGYQELCNRRYNEVTFILSHNAISNKFSLVSDQDQPLSKQLTDGIRAIKIPIHPDYKNPIQFYLNLLKEYQSILSQQEKILLTHRKNDSATIQRIANIEIQINDNAKKIKEIDLQIKKLEAEKMGVSLLKKSGINARLFLLQAQKKGLEAFIYTARQTLQGLQALLSPELLQIRAQKVLVKPIISFIETLGVSGDQNIFACHGLAKWELYKDFLGDLIDKAPRKIKPALEPLRGQLPKLVETVFGTKEQAGGIMPYMPCFLDRGKQRLETALQDIKKFLDNNPDQIVTIFLENYVEDRKALAEVFQKVGLDSYALVQSREALWPKLGQMITKGKRLVIFVNRALDPRYPWILNSGDFIPWVTQWTYKNVKDFTKKLFDIYDVMPAGLEVPLQASEYRINFYWCIIILLRRFQEAKLLLV